MLILTSPDQTRITVLCAKPDALGYTMTTNHTFTPGVRSYKLTDDRADVILRDLFAAGWGLRFELSRDSAPHLAQNGPPSDFLPPTKG